MYNLYIYVLIHAHVSMCTSTYLDVQISPDAYLSVGSLQLVSVWTPAPARHPGSP